jgi:hypothetical protein
MTRRPRSSGCTSAARPRRRSTAPTRSRRSGPLATRLRQDVQSTDATTWFSFDVASPGLVVIEAVTNNMGDPMLVLYDDFGREVAFNYDNGSSLDSLIAARVMPGTYVVGVRQMYAEAPVLTRMLFERYVPAQ